ncbi:MAG: hypothetical protein N2444_03815, partial [Methylocystis sp.]|nr:hypothetical protein [Methylocystis sp.]
KSDKAPRPGLAPARLDRSNFETLTTETPTSQVAGGSVLGSAITGLRAAARVGGDPTSPPASRDAEAAHDAPPADKFAP